ncbi:unnamed protein product [Calicophoron daubneyi]|uniref:BZIP domain-containing protein n=1 Tax=Calicophoron daubneyi TaxID=300641 RepID=A0AAV2T5N2_CALDB
MSGNSDSGTNATSIHLNEEDWLQLLQQLTPSSIDNLQHTLKRLQQREPPVKSADKLNFLATASQLCGSSTILSPKTEHEGIKSQGAPIVVSLGLSKTAVPSVITVPSVLNVSKSAANPLANTIVLPSSALLIAPSAHGQTFSLDNCVPISDVNRVVLNSGKLLSPSTSASLPNETFNSLNTLASAAVAVAASASGQTNWSSDLLISSSMTTAPLDSIRYSPAPLGEGVTSSSSHSASTASITSSTTPITADGILSALSGNHVDISSQLLPTLGAAGLTVYPLQVSGTGSTVFVAAAPAASQGTTVAQTLNLLDPIALQQTAGLPSSLLTSCTISSSSSSGSGCYTSPVTACAPSSTNHVTSVVSPTPFLTSTPRTKPKFKPLWETNIASSSDRASTTLLSTDVSSSSNEKNSVRSFGADIIASTGSSNASVCNAVTATTATVTQQPIVRTLKRQSPMLSVKSIGQTPKRLAAMAATLSEEAGKMSTQDSCKKLLLVCSQAAKSSQSLVQPQVQAQQQQQHSADSAISVSSMGSIDSVLSRVLQPRPPNMTPANNSFSLNQNLPNATLTDRIQLISGAYDHQKVLTHQPLLAPAGIANDHRTVLGSTADLMESVGGRTTDLLMAGKTYESGRRNLKEEAVGEDEARRRAKRRERNRVAAAKCRQRRQDQIVELQHRVNVLTKTGQELRTSLQSADAERNRLENLIRQHGLAGCPAAEETLNNAEIDLPEKASPLDGIPDDSEISTGQHPNDKSYIGLDDLSFHPISTTSTSSTSQSPSLILITSSVPTKPEPDPIEATGRPTLTKLDLRKASQAGRQNLLLSLSQQTVGANSGGINMVCNPGTGHSANGITTPVSAPCAIKQDETTVQSEKNTVSSTSESTTSYSSPSNLTRVASRPSSLLPPRHSDSSTNNISSTLSSGVVTVDTPTPYFWPSELHGFSPILTPSTWKLFKNLATAGTPHQSFLLTPTLGCSVGMTLPSATAGTTPSSPSASQLSSTGTGVVVSTVPATPSHPMDNGAVVVKTEEDDSLRVMNNGDCQSSPPPTSSSQSSIVITFSNCDNNSDPQDKLSSAVHP